MLVHQGTVNSFFDDILADCVDHAAGEQAAIDVLGSADGAALYAAGTADDYEQKEDDGQVVQNLVSSFLLPHVQRASVAQAVAQEQKKLLRAAHKTIYDAMQAVESSEAETKYE
jgi:hypothetical protein